MILQRLNIHFLQQVMNMKAKNLKMSIRKKKIINRISKIFKSIKMNQTIKIQKKTQLKIKNKTLKKNKKMIKMITQNGTRTPNKNKEKK